MSRWPTDIETIIFIQTAFLGDIILTTPCFDLCRKHWPRAQIIVVTTRIGQLALHQHPSIDEVVVLDKKNESSFGALLKVRTKIAKLVPIRENAVTIQPHRSFRSSILAKFLGLPTVTFDTASLSWLATLKVKRVAVLHEVERNALLLEPLGCPRHQWQRLRPSLPRAEKPPVVDSFDGRLANLQTFTGKLVGIAVGSTWATKKWPLQYFQELINQLTQSARQGVVLLGSTAEQEEVKELLKGFDDRLNIWNLVGATNFDDLRWLYPQLNLLVTNDSSPIHYASAFDIPTVAIFGATTSKMGFAPLAEHSICIEVDDLNCRPCSDHGPKVCPLGHFKCMRSILPQRILNECLKLLSQV